MMLMNVSISAPAEGAVDKRYMKVLIMPRMTVLNKHCIPIIRR